MNKQLADVAGMEAMSIFHGYVMGTKPNFQPIIQGFPSWDMRKWDNHWCAAFVYYCCTKAGISLPIKYPNDKVTCNFAGCIAWEQWAKLPEHNFWHDAEEVDFVPEPGDIVLFDTVHDGMMHDHMGIILENKEDYIVTAEGNFNNVSAIVNRRKDNHIRGYIRI